MLSKKAQNAYEFGLRSACSRKPCLTLAEEAKAVTNLVWARKSPQGPYLTPGALFDNMSPHMLTIRLQRVGRKKVPTFRLVLTDSKNSTKSGRFLEILGNHDFRKENTKIEADRVKHWIKMGAQLSDSAHNLLLAEKVITGKKINVLPKKTVPKKEEVAA